MQGNSSWLHIAELYLGTWLAITIIIEVGQWFYWIIGEKSLLMDNKTGEYKHTRSKPDLLPFGIVVLMAGVMSLVILFFN